ncbi:MAG: CAP domain-containing protein [Cyanobacteria bacterium J06600_6]
MLKVKVVIKALVVKQLLLTAIVAAAVGNGSITSSTAVPLNSNSQMSSAQADSAELDLVVQQIHESINQYRAEHNLPPLAMNAHVSRQAKIHSQEMAQEVVKFSHQGFKDRIKALEGQVIYLRAAENLAFNQGYQDPAQKAISGWLKSEGHHKNMIGDFNITGIGVAKNTEGEYYFTQIFIKEK